MTRAGIWRVCDREEDKRLEERIGSFECIWAIFILDVSASLSVTLEIKQL